MINKKERLLMAWWSLIIQYWYKSVSVDLITKTAWVGKWTFYLYFKNKEKFYTEVMDKIHEKWKMKIEKISKENKTLDKKIYYLLLQWIVFLEANNLKEHKYLKENLCSSWINKELIMKKKHLMLKSIFNNDNYTEKELDQLVFPIFSFFQEVIKFKPKIEMFENKIIWNSSFVFYNFVKQLARTIAKWLSNQKNDKDKIAPEFDFKKEISLFKKENNLFN